MQLAVCLRRYPDAVLVPRVTTTTCYTLPVVTLVYPAEAGALGEEAEAELPVLLALPSDEESNDKTGNVLAQGSIEVDRPQ